jgi:hypothetical protein
VRRSRDELFGAAIHSKIESIVRRLLEWIAAWRATFEHFELALHHAVARYQRVDSTLLPHERLTELLQRALEVSKLDLDGLKAMRFGHGRVVSTNELR